MTKPTYDHYYEEPQYFGDPYPGLIKFFESYEPKGHVLDLGCGQGRDSLCLGRLGYTVTGVDISTVGLEQMNHSARDEQLAVEGVAGNLYAYPVSRDHDIVLLDSILHFYKRDREKETKLIQRVASELRDGGILATFMIQGEEREGHLKRVLNEMDFDWEILCDDYTEYPAFHDSYHMYIVKEKRE
ncbi:class I SAM-dependent methyltransferase [Halobacillus kuroshimensis]|uniref:class I SAM-dependent methyltransferase n=1 Tax=Halobacillus kuroshimensis TaxID=302481 RepID=UPI00040A19BA|nr:class I SAM-dependent methyltransferase [Halobacillus kuroshimensis]